MPIYLPAEERVEIIRHYGQVSNIKTFVETGTSVGDTVAALIDDFDLIVTIELDESLSYRAAIRFADNPAVHCLKGDSGELLPSVIDNLLTGPTLFWLDGHYSGGPGRGAIDTPIIEELHAAVHAPAGSVILIDDARLFGGGPEHTEEFKDYPSLTWVMDFAHEHDFSFTLLDDIIRLTPQ